MKKFGFYCFDNAGGDAMKILAETAQAMGHEVVLFPKQESASGRAGEMANCDMVITGLSSFRTEEELDLVDALPPSVPWVIFEDVPDACLRPKAKEFAKRAKLVILAHPTGAQAAQDFGYVGSVYLGPPPQWRIEYQTLMQAKVENRRAKMLKVSFGQALVEPLSINNKVIGSIGSKEPEESNRVIGLLEFLGEIKGVVLAFGKHPGEKPDPKKGIEDVKRFERLLAERDDMFSTMRCATADDWKDWRGAHIAASADIMVYASATNISIAGAYARVPGIYLDDEGVQDRIRVQTGQNKWFVAELGGALSVPSATKFREMIRTMLNGTMLMSHLLEMQEAAFPKPPDFDDPIAEHSEQKIIRFLEQLQ